VSTLITGSTSLTFGIEDLTRCARRLAGGMFALILLFTSTACLAAQAGFTLQQLMSSLAQRKQGEVRFAETDYLQVLDQPVKSAGVLVYRAPDHLEKRTLEPKKESMILEGDELTVQRGHRTHRMQVSAYPQAAPYVDAIRDTLAGDEAGLEKVFKVGLTGTREGWQLELVPLDKDAARKVRRVEIAGSGDVIRSVEILQADGDRSVMTLGAPGSGSRSGAGG
jgi:outer membrane lipoprotein-sorting protein